MTSATPSAAKRLGNLEVTKRLVLALAARLQQAAAVAAEEFEQLQIQQQQIAAQAATPDSMHNASNRPCMHALSATGVPNLPGSAPVLAAQLPLIEEPPQSSRLSAKKLRAAY